MRVLSGLYRLGINILILPSGTSSYLVYDWS